MPDSHGRDRHTYRRKRDRLKRKGGPCWLCGLPIQPDLDWKHPMSWTSDHVIPLSEGGDLMGEIRPAHRSCNARRGNGKTAPSDTPPAGTWTTDGYWCGCMTCPHSRDWSAGPEGQTTRTSV